MAEPRIGTGKAGPGRPKGCANKVTYAVKEMVIQALNKAHRNGGIAYLTEQAKANPAAFLTLVGKVIPLQMAGDPDNPLTVTTRIEIVGVAASDNAAN